MVIQCRERHPELKAGGREDALEGGQIRHLRAPLIRGDRRLCRTREVGEARLREVCLKPGRSDQGTSASLLHIIEYIQAALDPQRYVASWEAKTLMNRRDLVTESRRSLASR